MKERINQLAHGAVQYEKPMITVTQSSIQDTVPEGMTQRAEIGVKSENGVPIRGFLYSSHARAYVRQDQIIGIKGQIGLEINAAGLTAGEQIRGQVQFVYNGGEMVLPYCFHIVKEKGTETKKTLETIQEFAALAKEEPAEALHFFSSERFLEMPFMKAGSDRTLYRGLMEGGSEERAMEEFLTAVGEKEPVRLSLAEGKGIFENPDKDTFGELIIEKNTWGYTALTMESDSPWLVLEKKRAFDFDFVENRMAVRYVLDEKQLHGGNNIGLITVSTASQRLTYEVYVKKGTRKTEKGRMRRADWFKLEQLYLEYQDKTYDDKLILAAMEGEVASLIKHYPDELRLYLLRSWLHMEQNQGKQAEKLLSWVKEPIAKSRDTQLENYCLYLFLNAMLTGEEAAFVNMQKLVHKYFEENDSIILALLELQVNPEYTKKPEMALEFLRRQFEKGSRSPLLYSMACRIFCHEPGLLHQMDAFEIMVFSYGAKRKIIGRDLLLRMLEIPVLQKQYLSVYFTMLTKLYEYEEEDALLGAICSLLIKTGSAGETYFPWYQKGVEKDLKLTSLYEYYLYSVPEEFDQSLPQPILMYYSYQNELDDKSRLLLYSNILKYHGIGSKIYESYSAQMEEFAISQLLEGRTSEKLVPLYATILHPDIVDEALAEGLPDLLFAKKITTAAPFAKRMIVRYPQLKKEISVPVKRGTACVPVYTKNTVILIEDAYGKRYSDSQIDAKPLMNDGRLLKRCWELCPGHLMMRIAKAEDLEHAPIQTAEQLELAKGLLLEGALEEEYQQFLLSRVIEYCYSSNDGAALDCDSLFMELDAGKLSERERICVIEILIRSEYYTTAYQLVHTYGYDGIKMEHLLKLAVRMIQEKLYEKNDFLVGLCYYLFVHNQYNDGTLSYLAAFYNGLTHSMYKLLVKIRKSSADAKDLTERVLAQMMFTEQYEKMDQVYQWYSEGKQVLEEMRMAYLVLKCDAYFMEREKVDPEKIRAVEVLILQKEWEEIPSVCSFALLTLYSRQKRLAEKEKKIASEVIKLLTAEGLVLSCFLALAKEVVLPYELEGRVILEYRKDTVKRVAAEGRRLPDGTYIKREMQQIYPGVFTKTFLLFEDEKVDLKLVGWKEDGSQETEERRITGEHVYMRNGSRFEQLNQMMRFAHQKEWNRLEECLKEAEITDGIIEKLFPMI